jgi:hypothetical protein
MSNQKKNNTGQINGDFPSNQINREAQADVVAVAVGK